MQGERIIQTEDGSNQQMSFYSGTERIETDTKSLTKDWSQSLNNEYYISAILFSELIFAEVIDCILFSVCCWQSCMAYDSCSIKIEIILKRKIAIITHGQCFVSMSPGALFLKS